MVWFGCRVPTLTKRVTSPPLPSGLAGPRSLTHTPERKPDDTVAPSASSRTFCANCSDFGPMNSPKTYVTSASGSAILNSDSRARRVSSPATRKIVNSDWLAICENT